MKNILRNCCVIALLLFFATCSTKQNLISYGENGKYGFKNTEGQIIISAEYDDTGLKFSDGVVQVKKGKKWGLINDKGKLLTEIKYDYLSDMDEEGMFEAQLNGKYGFIDKSGKEIIPFVYDNCYDFHYGMACVEQNNLWGFINTKGKIIIPIAYQDFNFAGWTENVMAAEKNNKWGFIDKKDSVVIPFDYYEVGIFSEGLAAASKDFSHWGYIDHSNNVIIPFDYDNPYFNGYGEADFTNGIAAVSKNEESGYINKKGDVIIPLKYYSIHSFFKGYAFAEIDNGEERFSGKQKVVSYGYVDGTGKEFMIPYEDRTNFDWNVKPAPKEIPNFSDTLKFFPPLESFQNTGGLVIGSTTYDSLGNTIDAFHWDTIPYVDSTLVTTKKEEPLKKWSLDSILNLGLTALREEPKNYPDLNRIIEVSIGYGLLLDGGNYGEEFMYPDFDRWTIFKEQTIYKIIGDESLREITWKWVMPYYKQSFQSMHPFHQKIYKDIAQHLKDYIDTYDEKKMGAYLKRDESHFAQYDSDGKYDPYRKLFAFVDRLILVHKVISVEDAKIWIDKTVDEVESW